jgi:mono/diheme cytochrome c family protein
MKKYIFILIKFSPLLFLIGIFIYSFFNYGISDSPGKVLYVKHCADCHGKNGEGIRQLIPPLAAADYAIKHFDSIPCWIRNGMNHKIVVNGKEYEQVMYPIQLNEIETANLVNYISKEFLRSQQQISSAKAAELLRHCGSKSPL